MVSVAGQRLLDYENQKSFVLIVRADDGRTAAAAELRIELNNLSDTAPALKDVAISVDENPAIGTELYDFNDYRTNSDRDLDGEPLRYWIVSGNEEQAFAIDFTTGKITVARQEPIDFEKRTGFTLLIRAEDPSGVYAVAYLDITINDIWVELPPIKGGTITIPEKSSEGTRVYEFEQD